MQVNCLRNKVAKLVRTAVFTIAAAGALVTFSFGRASAEANPPGGGPTRPRALPDLVISAVQPYYFYFEGKTITVDDELWVQITNQGLGAAGPFEMLFEWGFGYDYQMEYFDFPNGLGAGQSEWVVATADVSSISYNLYAANAQYFLWVNSTGSVVESNSANDFYYSPAK